MLGTFICGKQAARRRARKGEWMEVYRRRQSCLRPERAWRVRAEEDGVLLRTVEEVLRAEAERGAAVN